MATIAATRPLVELSGVRHHYGNATARCSSSTTSI